MPVNVRVEARGLVNVGQAEEDRPAPLQMGRLPVLLPHYYMLSHDDLIPSHTFNKIQMLVASEYLRPRSLFSDHQMFYPTTAWRSPPRRSLWN